MVILSIIYFYIGLFLYERRKMENNEESFGNVKVHIFIKFLTLIPIFLLVNFSDVTEDATALIIAVILSAVYYFVFDLIIRRKVPIKTTIFSFFISVVVIQMSILTMKAIDKDNKVELDYEDIKSISLGENSKSEDYFEEYYSMVLSDMEYELFDGNYFINDDELLDLILEAKSMAERYGSGYGDDKYPDKTLYFNIKLYSGKEYNFSIRIADSYYKKIINKLYKNKDYIKHIKDVILDNNGIYEIGNDIVDSKTKKMIGKEIENNLENNLENINKNYINNKAYYIVKNVYQNHKLISYNIPIDLSDNLFKIVAEFANNKAVDNIRGYVDDINVFVYKDGECVNRWCYDEEVLDFIEQHYNDEFNPSKKYYILCVSLETRDGYKTFAFYTNKVNEIEKMYQYDDFNDNNNNNYNGIQKY